MPRRVLIIEDSGDARRMLSAMLAASGHRVREAGDGAAGIAAARAELPEVVLLDIGLPDLDGYEVARQLRSLPGGHAVLLVAVTGYGQLADRARAEDAGFDVHLVKPVALEKLEEAMALASPVT